MKELVAKELAGRVRDGEVIGVGTGSTVALAIEEIGKRVKQEGLKVMAVPTSLQSAWLCEEKGVRALHPGYQGELAWGFDGADAVDENFWLIKGKGGALLQEKILAARCKKFLIIVDDSKQVATLAGIPIPVEVIPEASYIAEKELKALGARSITLRPATGKHGPIITEKGNIIYDAAFDKVNVDLEARIKEIVGVVESGLFIDYADEVLVASSKGIRTIPVARK